MIFTSNENDSQRSNPLEINMPQYPFELFVRTFKKPDQFHIWDYTVEWRYDSALVAVWHKNRRMIALLSGGACIFIAYSYSVSSISP